MKYCKTCLQPDTRPNTQFTVDGICPACTYFAQLQDVDWQERHEILEDLLEQFPRRSGQYFDCVVVSLCRKKHPGEVPCFIQGGDTSFDHGFVYSRQQQVVEIPKTKYLRKGGAQARSVVQHVTQIACPE